MSGYEELRVWDTGAHRKLPILGLAILINPCKVCDPMKELRMLCGLPLTGKTIFEIT